jgi:hypothetical protein
MAAEKFVSVSEVLKKFGKDFVDALGKSLDNKKDSTGKLRESIRFQIKIYGQSYSFNLLMEDYYKWVDEGRKPGKGIPIKELDSWLKEPATISKLKLFQDSKLTTGKGLKKTLNKNSRVKSLSFLINRKIKLKGIKPTHFFTNVLEDGRVLKLQSDLRSALKKDIIVSIKEI